MDKNIQRLRRMLIICKQYKGAQFCFSAKTHLLRNRQMMRARARARARVCVCECLNVCCMHTRYFPFLLNVTILLLLLLIMYCAASSLFLTECSAIYELSYYIQTNDNRNEI